MHEANERWWRQVRDVYPSLFADRRVLEVGSLDVNGSVRQFFSNCAYVGVDWRAGPGVDVVSLAHEMRFAAPFDVVISASMLEHDPHWPLSLATMADQLAPHGALLLSWGAAENQTHHEDTAPDGQFHALPAGAVLEWLEDGLGLYVERFMYERQLDAGGGWGECGLVAFRGPHADAAIGMSMRSELRAADRHTVEV